MARQYAFDIFGQKFTVFGWEMSIWDHFSWTKLGVKKRAGKVFKKKGKFEQLREEEGWIVAVLGLKMIYILDTKKDYIRVANFPETELWKIFDYCTKM